MKVVAFDTASPLVSVAALEDETLAGEIALVTGRGHSHHLLSATGALLDRLGWLIEDADLLVATRGPGSFTGLRVGVGTVRGLALAASRRAVGVSTLRTMASAFSGSGIRLAPLLDAGRGEVYAAVYSGDDPPRLEGEEVVVNPSDLRQLLPEGAVLAFGPGARRYGETLRSLAPRGVRVLPWQSPLAALAGLLACKLLAEGGREPEFSLSARYIRRSDARLPGRR